MSPQKKHLTDEQFDSIKNKLYLMFPQYKDISNSDINKDSVIDISNVELYNYELDGGNLFCEITFNDQNEDYRIVTISSFNIPGVIQYYDKCDLIKMDLIEMINKNLD